MILLLMSVLNLIQDKEDIKLNWRYLLLIVFKIEKDAANRLEIKGVDTYGLAQCMCAYRG